MVEQKAVKRKPVKNAPIFCVILFFLLASATTVMAAGGDVAWQYDVAATAKQEAKSSAVDSKGNVIITGFNEGAATGDYQTVKVSADGSGILWSASFDKSSGNDVATAVVIDSNDDVIVTGYAWGASNYDIHTIKYSGADGSVLWQNTYDGSANGHDYATAIAVDSINNVYVGGYVQDSSGRDDFILLKYGPDGPNPDSTPIWAASYGGSSGGHDRIVAIAAGVDGIAATGESQNVTPDFDLTIVKFGLEGSLLWEKRYADTGDGKGQDVAMDSAGNVVVTGYVSNGTDRDLYTVKYPAVDGTALWVKTFDGGYTEEGHALWIDENDDVTITGHVFALDSDNDVYTARYDGETGVEAWSQAFNTSNGNSDMGLGVRVKPGGDVYVMATANDHFTGFDDFLILKYRRDNGTLFWSATFDGAAKADRPTGMGFGPAGEVQVGGWSDRWTSGASDYDFYALSIDPGLINPPTDLTAQTLSNTQIALSWTDNSSNEMGFLIERKIGVSGTYSQIATTAADITNYNDSGLATDIRYYYRVRATHDTIGNSPYSNEAHAKTTVVSYDPPVKLYQFNSGDSGDDFPQAIAVGPDNHPVVTGYSFALVGAFDYLTAKLDRADASEQWKARYNDGDNESDYATSVAVDGSNQVLVTGYASLYGGGAGNTNDIYTLGYPSTGPPASWSDQYNGPSGNDDRSSSVAVAVDGSNNSVVVGYGRNADFNDDVYVLKYAPDGTRLWAATPYDGGGEDHPEGVAFGPAGDIFVGGYTFNGTDRDFFVAKYDGATGAMAWGGTPDTYNGPGNGDDYVTALAVDASGYLYVTGYSFNAAGNGDFVTIKYDGASGAQLWVKSFDGTAGGYDSPASLQVDPVNGDILVAGTSFVSAGNHDFQIIRYDSAGNAVWSKTLDRPESDEAVADMSIDRSGTVCVVGYTNEGVNDDVLAVKYDHTGLIIGANVYNGAANSDDQATAVTSNDFGETFVAGFTTAAGGDTDFLVFEADGQVMQTPFPFTANIYYTHVDLSWTDNSLNGNGFDIERKVGSCDADHPWSLLDTLAAGVTTYTDSGLSIGSTYCYRVRSFNGSGEPSRWLEHEVTTAAPSPPSGLTASPINTTEIELVWTDNTVGETGFTIERCLGLGCDFSTVDIMQAGAEATTYSDVSACSGQTYSYRVKAYKTGEWVTAPSNGVADQGTSSPTAPSNLVANAVTEERVDIQWTDHTSDETHFLIERCAGSGCTDFSQVGSVVGVAGEGNTISFSDQNVAHSTTFNYRVRAHKSSSCPWSTSPTVALEVYTAPPAPADLTAAALDSSRIGLSWTDNTTSETGFVVERCIGAGCSEFVQFATTAANSGKYEDDSVCADNTYTYRVKAVKAAEWESLTSSEAAAVVLSSSTPSTFEVTGVSEEQISLQWLYASTDYSGLRISRCQGDATACSDDLNYVQIADITGASSGKVLDLGMDEISWNGTSGEVKDRSGGGNHGTATGNATTVASGHSLRAGTFDGSNSSVTTPLNIDQSATSPGATFEAWVYPTVHSYYYKGVIGTDNGGTDWSLLQRYSTWYVLDGTNYTSTNVSVDLNAWQHIVVVFDPANGIQFYKNGAQVWSSPSIGFDTSDAKVTIGRQGSSGYYFPGLIDEVAVYDRPLTAEEVLGSYEQRGTFADGGLPSNTSYHYRLGSYKDSTCGWESGYLATNATTLEPPAPTGLTATAPHTTRIDISWADNTTSETGYRVERCLGQGTACDDSEFSLLLELAADTTSFSDESICSGTDYTYRIRAEKTDGPTWQTAWAQIQTNTLAPSMPASFALEPVSESVVGISWEDMTIDEDSFVLERCLGSGTACDGDTEFAAILTVPGTVAGNLMHLRMDETAWNSTVDEVVDASGKGNHGQAYNGLTTVSAGRFGRGGDFDGSNDFIQTPLTIDQTEAGPGATFEAWVNPSLTNYYYRDVISTENGGYDWGIMHYNGLWYVYTGSGRYSTGLSVEVGQWQHVAAVFIPGTGIKFYKNGVEKLISAISYDDSTQNLHIGRKANALGYYFQGKIDEVAIFNRPLSAVDIQNHYQSGFQQFSHTDTGLVPGTDYTYRLYATKSATCGWISPMATATVATLAPPPPTNLEVISPNTTELDLSWTDNSSSETGYRLERCLGSGTSCDEVGAFSLLSDLAADVTTYQDDTVCSGQSYTYRVRAEKTDGPVWETTWEGPVSGTATLFSDPNNLSATRGSEVEINLSWTDTAADETGFKIERCMGTGCDDFVQIADLSANVTTYRDEDLTPNVTYTYRLAAYKTATCSWTSGYSNTVEATTTVLPPSGLTATTVNTTRIDLVWTDNAATETGTLIERCTGSGCSDFSEVHIAPPGTSSYSDMSVAHSTSYTYRAQAENDGVSGSGNAWISAWSNNDSATTDSPLAPSSLTVAAVSDSQVNLSWVNNTSDETGLKVERCTGSECTSFTEIVDLGQGSTNYSDTSVAASTVYNYRVRSYKTATQGWISGYSNDAEDLTFSAAASGLTASPLNSRMIRLDWMDNSHDEDGYEIEVQVWNREFVLLDIVSPNETTYTDSVGIQPETVYRYRVRPFRGANKSPYSNEAETLTPAWQDGDSACPLP